VKKILLTMTILLLTVSVGYGQTKQAEPVVSKETQELIDAVITRPMWIISYPECPPLTDEVKIGLAKELSSNPTLKLSYEKLNAKKRNREWFEGVKELSEANAIWCLTSGLCHPADDVQIKCAKALGSLRDKRPVPFMLIVAERFAIREPGGESATAHERFQYTLADALNKITGASVVLIKGEQDPEGLKKGIPIWRSTLAKPQHFQLTIKSDKDVYEVGEEIVLTASLNNISQYDFVYLIPDVHNNYFPFWAIETKDGNLERIRPQASVMLRESDYATLHSGQTISYDADIITTWKFAKGMYKIKANYKGENWYMKKNGGIAEMDGVFSGTLTSNTITIEVVEKK